MTPFKIILAKKIRVENSLLYVEFVPDSEYDDTVKKCDTITQETLDDYIYLESVKTELYNILSEMFGVEFTDKYSL
jgi:hypothetical protein